MSERPDSYEDPGESILEPDEPLSDEVTAALAVYGIPFSDWKPKPAASSDSQETK